MTDDDHQDSHRLHRLLASTPPPPRCSRSPRTCEIATVFSRSRTITPCSTGADGRLLQAVRDGPVPDLDGQGRRSAACAAPTADTVAARNFVRSGRRGHRGALRPRPRRRAHAAGDRAAARSRARPSPTRSSSPRSPATWASRPRARTSSSSPSRSPTARWRSSGSRPASSASPPARPQKRQDLWRKLDVVPRGIDREIVEAHAPHRAGQRPERTSTLLDAAIKYCARPAAGAARCSPPTCRTSIFGTPVPVRSSGQPRRAQGRRGQHPHPRPRAAARLDDRRRGAASPR